MCGIAGFIGGATFQKDSSSALHLKNMNNQLTQSSRFSWLLARSVKKLPLVIEDLQLLTLSSAGHQPMTSSSGRYVITYNGGYITPMF